MNDIVKSLMNENDIKNINAVPKVEKITINIGVGANQKEKLAFAEDVIWKITGQKPQVTKAKKSVAGFSVREGWPIGVKVTLRTKNMKAFQDKLLQLVLPATRDFEGLSPKSFDGRGNFSFGITDHTVFPEIPFSPNSHKLGMDVTVVTTSNSDNLAKALLDKIGYPFKKLKKKGDSNA